MVNAKQGPKSNLAKYVAIHGTFYNVTRMIF